MPDPADAGRANQRGRTRKDLLSAAARLLKEGRPFGMDEVAAAAMVSRATAYRYFPSIEALLVEAPLEGQVPTPEDLFARADAPTDPADRVALAESALHDACYKNQAQLRLMLAASLQRSIKDPAATDSSGGEASNAAENAAANAANGAPAPTDIPLRQNRRTPLIDAALAPARHRLTDDAYDRLRAALALILGTESMIVLTDVLNLDEPTAREVKAWAARTLVQAALNEP